MSKAGPITTKTQLVKDWVRRIEKLDRSKSVREKFRDFCEMAYCAIAKTTAPTPERADELEARYMQIVGTYQDKDTVRAYPELLAMIVDGLELGWDMLGMISSELNALSAEQGQFFTPMEVSLMMARMQFVDLAPLIEQQGYITVSEPAAGAGGMILAASVVLREQGFDPARHMLVWATDISPIAYHMCYIQLALAGITAYVERGNSLSLEHFAGAWTPTAHVFYATHGHLSFTHDRKPGPAAPEPGLIQLPLF